MKLKKYKLIFTSLLLLFPAIAAQAIVGQDNLQTAAERAGFGSETNVYVIVSNWINGFLSIFTMVFTYFLISAGFTWMTSGGNVEKVASAKNTIKNALIGLIVALTAYALTRYVLLALGTTTGVVAPPT